jgi:hypothetical protein
MLKLVHAKAARAARNRRHYLRRKEYKLYVGVEVDQAAIDLLQRLRWLSADEHDTAAIARAIENMLKLSAKI